VAGRGLCELSVPFVRLRTGLARGDFLNSLAIDSDFATVG
jgi:hypothetical protein